MTSHRRQRIAEQIQRRASQFIMEELKDPRIGFLTIVDVEVNADITSAKLFVSVLGDEAEQAETMAALGRARGVIKRDIGDWLRIRTVPDIRFELDTTVERGTRILKLIKGLEQEGTA